MSLVKKLQPGGDITNPTIPKPATQKKIKLNIDGQEREFDQEDIDSMYSNILGGLDDKNKEYGRQYLEKINTALQQGNARINVGGKTALKMEIDPSIGYQQENQMYSESELKRLYPNKQDRQAFKERSNVIQGIHRQLGDLVAQKYSGIKEKEATEAEQGRQLGIQNALQDLERSSTYSTAMHGKAGEGVEGLNLALQDFAKMNEAQRSNAIKKWFSSYASKIYGLDQSNKDISNKYREKYGNDLGEMKARLSPFFISGKFNEENVDLGKLSDILQNRLLYNQMIDKNQLARWKAGQFGAIQEQTTPTDATPAVTPTQTNFTGIKDGVQYNKGQAVQGMFGGKYYVKGKLFTGYVSPYLIPDESGVINYEKAYDESRYGGFIGGKRMSDTEFRNYYNKLSTEQRKQFAGYEQAKQSMYTPSVSYQDLLSIPKEKGNIASFLKVRGFRYAQDVTDLYPNKIPKSRIIAVYDQNKALKTGTPWAKNISYYRVFYGKNGGLEYEPIEIDRASLGSEKALLPSGNKWFLGQPAATGVTGSEFSLPEYKSGGELKKLAKGGAGLITNVKARAYDPNKVKENLAARANKQATMKEVFTNKEGYELSSADTANLIALGADFGGLVAGMMGASVVSGGLGLGGTAANLYASGQDADGYSAGDFGRAGLSGLLDLASMVPGVGLGAKMFKITKSIKGMSNVLKYTGMALKTAGYADMSRAIYKLATEGPSNMNIDDMRSAMGGIRMVLGGFKATNRANTIAPSQEVKSFDIKNKEGKIFTTKLSAEDELRLQQMENPIEKNAFLKSLAKKEHKIDNIDQFGVVQKKSLTPFRSEGSRSWKPLGKTSKPELTTTQEVQNANLTDEGATGLNWAQKALYTKRQALKDKAYFDSRNAGKSHAEAEKISEKVEGSIEENIDNFFRFPTDDIIVPAAPEVISNPVVQPIISTQSALPVNNSIASRQPINSIYQQIPEKFNVDDYLSRFQKNRTNSNILTTSLINRKQGLISTPSLQVQQQIGSKSQLLEDLYKQSNINPRTYNGRRYTGQNYYYKTGKKNYYKEGGEVIFAKNGIKSLINTIGQDISNQKQQNELYNPEIKLLQATPYSGILNRSQTNIKTKGFGTIKPENIQLDYKTDSSPQQKDLFGYISNKNIMSRKLTQLNTGEYNLLTKKPKLNKDLSQNTFGLDLARTLAGNIANQQFDQTIVAPQYQNIAESYLAAPSTSLRDAASIASQQYINRRPQTSDAILNQKIQMSNLDKANRLKMQGEAEYSDAFEENKQKNAALAQEYAQYRASVANQNAASQAEAENKRIQLANTVRGLNAENLQNFATRWVTKSEQDKLQNKGINTELALNELASQTSGEQNKMLNRYNYLNSLEAAGQLTPELSNEKNDLEKKYAAYNTLTKNISLNIYKNPNYQYNLLEEKKKVGLSKDGGLLQIENKYNLKRAEDINRSLQTKYNLTVKNNLELLKDILKSTKR